LDATHCRISLRSMGRYPVNQIARQFGGGGHQLAAGLQLSRPAAEVAPDLLARLRDLLSGKPG